MSFWCLQFFQKTNENNSAWGIIVLKSNFFVRFLGELKIPKIHFEINWPLEGIGLMRKCETNLFLLLVMRKCLHLLTARTLFRSKKSLWCPSCDVFKNGCISSWNIFSSSWLPRRTVLVIHVFGIYQENF